MFGNNLVMYVDGREYPVCFWHIWKIIYIKIKNDMPKEIFNTSSMRFWSASGMTLTQWQGTPRKSDDSSWNTRTISVGRSLMATLEGVSSSMASAPCSRKDREGCHEYEERTQEWRCWRGEITVVGMVLLKSTRITYVDGEQFRRGWGA